MMEDMVAKLQRLSKDYKRGLLSIEGVVDIVKDIGRDAVWQDKTPRFYRRIEIYDLAKAIIPDLPDLTLGELYGIEGYSDREIAISIARLDFPRG